jgi:hypothetical protein
VSRWKIRRRTINKYVGSRRAFHSAKQGEAYERHGGLYAGIAACGNITGWINEFSQVGKRHLRIFKDARLQAGIRDKKSAAYHFGAQFVTTRSVVGMVNAMYQSVDILSTTNQERIHCYAFHRTFRRFNPRASQSVDCERVVFVRSNSNRLRYEASVKRPGFFAS